MNKRLVWIPDGGVCSPQGFKGFAVAAGIKESNKLDLMMLLSEKPAQFAVMSTTNTFAAAPVRYCREIARTKQFVRGIIVNSGNANACTGPQGERDVRQTASYAAELLGLNADDFLVCSTGKIGILLPIGKIEKGLEVIVKNLTSTGCNRLLAESIMTTDLHPKYTAISCSLATVPITIGAMAKGAGMIYPRLSAVTSPHATLLSFITTDATFEPGVLQYAFHEAVDRSFNRISIDGDTSTNDTVICLANGASGISPIRRHTIEYEIFLEALIEICLSLAKQLVRDGEGVTKVVEIHVTGAETQIDAERIARSIANSLLCKTAWFGCDPNWGRILDAAGYSGATIDPNQTELKIQGVPVFQHGIPIPFDAKALSEKMKSEYLLLELNLALGSAEYTMWTGDLSYEYVKINAEYHT